MKTGFLPFNLIETHVTKATLKMNTFILNLWAIQCPIFPTTFKYQNQILQAMKRSSRRWKKKRQMRWKWQRKRMKKERRLRKQHRSG